MKTIDERFWAKVDRKGPDECWLWQRGARNGYGRFAVTRDDIRTAHRVAWELTNGTIPEGLNVCHNCPDGDNPACCNPSHLWLGTQLDNMRDAKAKGRLMSGEPRAEHMRSVWRRPHRRAMVRRGARSPAALLTQEDIDLIRLAHETLPVRQTDIARAFGVSKAVVWLVVHQVTYKS